MPMIGFIIWLVGVILTIKAAVEIWKLNADAVKKLLAIILIILTSWVGLAFYYFYAKDKMADWLK
jgi:membrane protein DedA with SNARE-associated domain